MGGEIFLAAGESGSAEQDFLLALSLADRMGAVRFRDRAIGSLRSLRENLSVIDALQVTSEHTTSI